MVREELAKYLNTTVKIWLTSINIVIIYNITTI